MYGLTESDLDIQKRAASFSGELIPFEVTAELAGGELPAGVTAAHAARARELGLCATNMPAGLGGGGCTTLQQVLVQEQAGRVTNALGWVASTPPSWLPPVATADQLDRILGASGRSATRSPRRAPARTSRRSRRPPAATATATC